MKTELNLFERTLTLHRFPEHAAEQLQAWDAGDEYLIRHAEELDLAPKQNILIINDQFGALACWFSEHHNVTVMSDSFISRQGALQNLERNQCPAVQFMDAMSALPNDIDLVLMQLPKNNRYLTWLLSQLRRSISESCPVIAVNKAKEIHSSTLKLFDKYLGDTRTSLAWKKHRLVFSFANSQPQLDVSANTCWTVEHEDISLTNLPNVYSGESLDLGARFMLEHIPQNDRYGTIIDLGCGNGVLSVKTARLNPNAQLICVDESLMAVQSAKINLSNNVDSGVNVQYIANNCLDGFEKNSADLVLCNPPFHQQQAVTDHIAWQMFCDAKQVLSTGGELLVIGNRHLGYDKKLAKLFGKNQVKRVASNAKFVILQATK
jgi:16S rRNA (guanine1207-N2)-methyltransferase